MKAKRRRHDPEFKARVALDAIKGEKTIQEIAKIYEVLPIQVSDWKKAMLQGASSVFGSTTKAAESENFEVERTQLHAKIGQLTCELDWLVKKSKQLGL